MKPENDDIMLYGRKEPKIETTPVKAISGKESDPMPCGSKKGKKGKKGPKK
jgi:hypothetical protein